jgi:hypothetical protein
MMNGQNPMIQTPVEPVVPGVAPFAATALPKTLFVVEDAEGQMMAFPVPSSHTALFRVVPVTALLVAHQR